MTAEERSKATADENLTVPQLVQEIEKIKSTLSDEYRSLCKVKAVGKGAPKKADYVRTLAELRVLLVTQEEPEEIDLENEFDYMVETTDLVD